MPNLTTTQLPPLDLLSAPPFDTSQSNNLELNEMAKAIESCLALYNVTATVAGISQGPIFTLFELHLAPGVMSSRISALEHDLARTLSAEKLRVLHTIPGKHYVGIELQNKHRQPVYLRDVLASTTFQGNSSPLSVSLGVNATGKPVVVDLARMPHLLIGGMTGSGKSMCLDAIIISMLYKATPDAVRFIMVDPKMLDLSLYEGIPHLLTSVITNMKDAAHALSWCVINMERRYKLMLALGVRNLADYNTRIDLAEAMGRPIPDPFWKPTSSIDITPPMLVREPYIVAIVDNFTELTMEMGEQVKDVIVRLTQKAHDAGIHLIMTTSLPSVSVMDSSIKVNIPSRIALTVRSKGDSNAIIDRGEAELLLGAGDMLYTTPSSNELIRAHGAFVSEQDIHAVVRYWKTLMTPQYINGILGVNSDADCCGLYENEELDPLFDQAVSFVLEKRRASISGIQRQFRIGYNRAAQIIEQMEAQCIISSPGVNGNREVLAPPFGN
ncbi:DNA translocase FtsK [Yersinia ruckeri]|nr:DNA translocase FtsK [Yersinia ruckeri]